MGYGEIIAGNKVFAEINVNAYVSLNIIAAWLSLSDDPSNATAMVRLLTQDLDVLRGGTGRLLFAFWSTPCQMCYLHVHCVIEGRRLASNLEGDGADVVPGIYTF